MADPIPPPPLSPARWPAWILIGLGWTVARWPLWLQRAVGPGLGWLMRHLLASRRRVAAINLALCYPELNDAQRDRLLRDNFRALGLGVFEFLRAWWGRLPPASECELDGLEHLEAARAGGRGVILVSAHFTTLEISMRLLCQRIPLAGMYRPHEEPAMEWAVKRGRLRHAVAMFSRDELRPALRHLKQGGLLWFAPDQETRRGDSVFVPFFGQPAWSLTSTHQLARLSGAAVLPLFHERRPDGRYRIQILPALQDFPSNDATADTARIMAALEDLVRRCPTQYLWLHQRFKRQPDGSKRRYG
ncbi:MAG: LpxL/LpxP family Kdo(2)-lipid IV(A) lauroyl/palmitoleoyl acyltransferase [Arenimonas sp.]|uniref:LpxL/LpxP family Kdo(2)-lipid IV(A) lauroyl/palmitoleoyl acyltransferase n=1 Tax=Arenimonas sp. TaxID=1872635 RepID=UPI0025BADD26|nr:LpxL/LpxP family Kdo(2)-lipid IV(A) lauroyl/palmitoleoyl acyltransferase [Arenimonas sp.]MBW8367702.1 LpxL/LpxP family Kdo(2)-lipid IV(A) lauroyl/palmitoleoyl acyltransferase [Arenimonas sp.]